MTDRAAIRSSVLHMLPLVFDQRGGALSLAYRRAGLDQSAIEGRKPIIARAQALTALSVSGRLLGDEAISLTCALAADPARLGLIGRTLIAGATLRQCLEAHARALPTFQGETDIRLAVRGEDAFLSLHLTGADPEMARFLYEGAFAFNIATIRSVMGASWTPRFVQMPHRAPHKTAPFEEFFGSPIRFGAGASAVIKFPASDLDARVKPSTSAEPEWKSFEREKGEIDAFALGDDQLVEALENIIDVMMMTGKISLPAAASALGLSTRNAQRRLSRLGTSFEELTEGRRRKRAIELLGDSSLRIAEVALALGYSDSAHFIRAFGKWFGAPPSMLRSSLL
ncbi:AraC family transcriptional regulator [Methylocystis heyeri]|uniref:Helix-turn-helix domain-containing protein n=1 Tax=Methylocystis heyeri TaxID=391905 RepID=A0A6B8KBJ5_9HYPH|nr:AraC family transcriptional regulator [Methylocystis heyeri]QGM45774.1 helix-turn-helix domain-containing protein [Methylocystis heyeri]